MRMGRRRLGIHQFVQRTESGTSNSQIKRKRTFLFVDSDMRHELEYGRAIGSCCQN
jgi:hypothetical protein